MNEEVLLWMNTVGPHHNRQETYSYFSLPFCRGPKKTIGHYHETLGEALQGVQLDFSGLEIAFRVDVPSVEYCQIYLTDTNYKTFVYAVKNYYWYQMYIDDLPIWGIVGNTEPSDDRDTTVAAYTIWTHKKFNIGYNGGHIVDVNLTSEQKVLVKPYEIISFSYEVHWKYLPLHFERRFDKYLDPEFFQHRVHWFSIFNSFMMVVFLVGLVSMILMRNLKKDYARYSKNDSDLEELGRDLDDEYGWKQVHGDVFRPMEHHLLFSVLIGCGSHMILVTFCVILFAIIVGNLYTERGSLLNTCIFVYAMTTPVNGYFGGTLYVKCGGKKWIKQMLAATFFLPMVICGTAFIMNFVAVYYHASRAIPITAMCTIAGICFFIMFPLTLAGTIIGRNLFLWKVPNYPCRINAVPRPIPEKKWFMNIFLIALLGGVLPFGSIFIKMYFILTSFWAYKIYYVYGFTLLVFSILIIVTACVTIVCSYLLLNSEDYRWQWTSFLCGASISLYIYAYSVYFFFFKTKMNGLFQTIFYFGNMAIFSSMLGIMCGTIGYVATFLFVHKIYTTVKID